MVKKHGVSSVPSGYRIRKGIKKGGKEKHVEAGKKKTVFKPPPRAKGGSRLPLAVAFLALLLSLAGFGLAFFNYSESIALKEDARSIAVELKNFRDAPIELKSNVVSTAKVYTAIPLRDALSSSFGIPVSAVIPFSGTGTIRSPTLGTVDVDFEAEIPVNRTLVIHPSAIPEEYKLEVQQTQPIVAEISTSITPREAWPRLNSIIEKLEKIAS